MDSEAFETVTRNYRTVKEWMGRISNIQACAREIVDGEIIYQYGKCMVESKSENGLLLFYNENG